MLTALGTSKAGLWFVAVKPGPITALLAECKQVNLASFESQCLGLETGNSYINVYIQAYFGAIVGSVPDDCNEANMAMKRLTHFVLVSQCLEKLCLLFCPLPPPPEQHSACQALPQSPGLLQRQRGWLSSPSNCSHGHLPGPHQP